MASQKNKGNNGLIEKDADITFRDARDAQNAVKTYDGGDMNGRRIKAFIV